jgi:alkylation response protein AidB-like acyl-CoA dehydrogenase
MDFSLTPQQRRLVDLTREVSASFAARAKGYDDDAAFPEENFREIRAAGLLALTVPEEYGGYGLWQGRNYLGYYLAIEEMAKQCSSTAQLLQVHCHAIGYLALHANKAQKDRYLPLVVNEGKLFASCGSEASVRQTGPEPFDATLRRAKDGWRLKGYKGFASLASAADYYVCWALAEGTKRMADGMMFAIVPKNAPGVRLENDWDVMGMRSTVSWGIHLDDVPLSDLEVAGVPGCWVQGDPRTFTLAFAANHLGTAQGVFDYTVAFVRERAFLRDSPLVQAKLGELEATLHSTRALIHHGAWLWEQGRHDEAERLSMCALHAGKQTALEITSRAFDICGARAAYRVHPLERAFRDVRTFTLHFREERILQMVAQATMGLPFHSKLRYGPRLSPEEMARPAFAAE